MRKHPSYTALLRPTRLLISEKSATYTIKWSYTIIWQVRVQTKVRRRFRKILWPSQNIWTLHVSFETFWSQMYFKYLHMIHTYFIKVQKLAYDNAVWIHAYLNTVAVIWSLPKGQTKWMCKYLKCFCKKGRTQNVNSLSFIVTIILNRDHSYIKSSHFGDFC